MKQFGDKHWLKRVQDGSKYCNTNPFCPEFPPYLMVPPQMILAERDEAAQNQVEKCFSKHCAELSQSGKVGQNHVHSCFAAAHSEWPDKVPESHCFGLQSALISKNSSYSHDL
ncbi:hypothetical protein HGM15179_008591 [Zosterops borbonicus]|uniref:Uncharacterized protein n=1 Tax=Zosterops borbonicus TaxID=364589 RepID=A0A8K1GIJ8_9PASS|nr:hypothetical protein HGM15179_008591 [Zosterops borbonicus]